MKIIYHLVLFISILLGSCFLSYSQNNCFCGWVQIKHSHRILQHSNFTRWKEVKEDCSYIEFSPVPFYVAADGTESSKFELEISIPAGCASVGIGEISFLDGLGNPINFSDPEYYGEMIDKKINGTQASFIYKHPTEYPDDGEKEREIQINAYNTNGFIIAKIAIKILRIPVIMVHGLWSSSSSFDAMADNFKADEYKDYLIRQADYSDNAGGSFTSNSNVLPHEIICIVAACRNEETAVGKVNLVGHSMGGILSRLHLGQSYKEVVNRLITCNTPHSGSQMADFLYTGALFPGFCTLLSSGMSTSDTCSDAIEDLQVEGTGIETLNQLTHPAEVGVHALHTQKTFIPSFLSGILTKMPIIPVSFILSIDFDPNCLSGIFNNDTHDLVVATESQKGGLSFPQITFVDNQQHMGSTANDSVIAEVKATLNAVPTSTVYTTDGFDPPVLTYDAPPCFSFDQPTEIVKSNSSSSSLILDAPLANTNYNIGDTIAINYTAGSDIDSVIATFTYNIDSVIVYKTVADGSLINIPIPETTLLGSRTLMIHGQNNTGAYVTSDWIELWIETTANLTNLTIHPPTLFLADESILSLEIYATYDDGAIRNMSLYNNFSYTFTNGNADTININDITLLNLADDDFVITHEGITSNTVLVNYISSCDKLDNVWVGPTSGSSWHESSANWSLDETPGICDHVIIPAGNTLILESGEKGYGYTLEVEIGADLEVEDGADLYITTEE